MLTICLFTARTFCSLPIRVQFCLSLSVFYLDGRSLGSSQSVFPDPSRNGVPRLLFSTTHEWALALP